MAFLIFFFDWNLNAGGTFSNLLGRDSDSEPVEENSLLLSTKLRRDELLGNVMEQMRVLWSKQVEMVSVHN